jgi:hypothetical protein
MADEIMINPAEDYRQLAMLELCEQWSFYTSLL